MLMFACCGVQNVFSLLSRDFFNQFRSANYTKAIPKGVKLVFSSTVTLLIIFPVFALMANPTGCNTFPNKMV